LLQANRWWVLKQFKVVYKEEKSRKVGLAFEVARNVSNFLCRGRNGKYKRAIKDFGIRTNIWTYFKSSNFTISGIDKGNVDRIEERNGVMGL
jgi:hypothetical protein